VAGNSNDPARRLNGVTHTVTGNQTADIHVCATGFHSVSIAVCLGFSLLCNPDNLLQLVRNSRKLL